MNCMTLIPRAVAFDANGYAICAGVAANLESGLKRTIFLPTDHYDFIGPINVAGKTEDEIRIEVQKIMGH